MILPRVGAALFVGAALLLTAVPAVAAPPEAADLEFRVAGEKVVRTAGKPFFLQLRNHGPGAAQDIVVTVDIAGIDGDKLDVQLPTHPECTTTGTKSTCPLGALDNGETDSAWQLFTAESIDGNGAAGSFTVEVTSSTPDPDPTNNQKTTVAVQVVPRTYDLGALAFDVYGDATTRTGVEPGETAVLPFVLYNFGARSVRGVEFTISLPPYVTFAQRRNDCEYNGPNTVVTCQRANVRMYPGRIWTLVNPMLVRVAENAPGPVALPDGLVSGGALADEAPPSALARSGGGDSGGEDGTVAPATSDQVRRHEADPSDNSSWFSVFTARNPADLAVAATAGSGKVGDTVVIDVTVANNGPADSPETAVEITAPTGTELVEIPDGCTFTTPAKVARCEGLLDAGDSDTGPFGFKIVAATVGTDGKAVISGTLDDPNPENNTAPITITVTGGGLPITGVNAMTMGGIGAVVLLAGGVLFVLARRRRVVPVAPSEDG